MLAMIRRGAPSQSLSEDRASSSLAKLPEGGREGKTKGRAAKGKDERARVAPNGNPGGQRCKRTGAGWAGWAAVLESVTKKVQSRRASERGLRTLG